MDREEARRYVREQLENYLSAVKGINPRKLFHCLNPEHPDQNPSMSFDRRRNLVHCFACGRNYDTFDLIGLDHGLTEFKDIAARAYEIYGLTVGQERTPARPAKKPAPAGPDHDSRKPNQNEGRDYGDYFRRSRERLAETDYLEKRSLSRATAEKFGLGFDPEFPAGKGITWPALIIPTGGGSFTARNTDPGADKSARVRKRGAAPVFNAEALWRDFPAPARTEPDAEEGDPFAGPPVRGPVPPVFVVEGEIDALSFNEAGAEAVALGSTANVGAFLSLIEERPPTRLLLVALDNDEEGRRAAQRLKEGLVSLQAPFLEVSPYGEAKDANEALCGDFWAFASAVDAALRFEERARETERAAYLETSVAHHLPAFRGAIAAKVDTPGLATGFARLDEALDGGLFEGLYIMGGISSLGKTSLALQLADQLAADGREVLIFSLEMARSELMAKSLSRLTLAGAIQLYGHSGLAKTARGISSGSRYPGYSDAERAVIEWAVGEYGVFAHRLFISEGVGDIGAAQVRGEVERHVGHTGRRPVVIVDYLQILAPWNERATDKQNTDKSVLELKRLSRDFKIPVLGLSSFNRANYREAVTMEAFKESGAIEYSSDVLIGLQLKGAGEKDFDALAAKEKNPREVELVILKNRQGPAGVRVPMEYYPLFNYFREQSV